MKRTRTTWRALLIVAMAGVLTFGTALTGSAHETREVGDFQFVVGFINEPAYLNELNGIDLRISRIDDDDHNGDDQADDNEDPHDGGSPVENAHQTLRAAIIFGGESLEVDLRPVWGQPGAYTADVIPTRTGAYSFQFVGEIDGQEINETFRSSPDTFSEVEDRSALLFPSEGLTASRDSDQAVAIGIAGVVAGLLGLVAGAAGYFKATNANPQARPARQARQRNE